MPLPSHPAPQSPVRDAGGEPRDLPAVGQTKPSLKRKFSGLFLLLLLFQSLYGHPGLTPHCSFACRFAAPSLTWGLEDPIGWEKKRRGGIKKKKGQLTLRVREGHRATGTTAAGAEGLSDPTPAPVPPPGTARPRR